MMTDAKVRGVPSRFDTAYRDVAPRLLGVVTRVVGDRAEAEDVVQEAFARLDGQPVLERRPDDIAAWLHRVALNLAFNRVRDRRRWQDRAERGGRLHLAGAQTPEPLDEVIRAEEAAGVRAALAQLPDKQRDCLLLRHSGYSYAEIAEIVGIAAGSVGTTLVRAERAFRSLVAQENDHDLS
jgi:RNA polymerase sigma-70 factor (ECF subfamily)